MFSYPSTPTISANALALPFTLLPSGFNLSKDIDVREDFKIIAEMHKVLLHQLIFTLKDTGYDIESDEFVKESGFMGEVIRATLMREMGYSNPMSKFINAVVNLDMKDGKSYANFDSNNLMKLLDKKDDKKK